VQQCVFNGAPENVLTAKHTKSHAEISENAHKESAKSAHLWLNGTRLPDVGGIKRI
jgi:hypothetical protein